MPEYIAADFSRRRGSSATSNTSAQSSTKRVCFTEEEVQADGQDDSGREVCSVSYSICSCSSLLGGPIPPEMLLCYNDESTISGRENCHTVIAETNGYSIS